AVGASRAVLDAERGPKTRVVDLGGKSVLPGLIDSHVHPLGAGESEFRQALPPLNSFSAVQQYIRDEARRTPKGQWIVVPRTFPTRLAEMRMPTREVLDVTTDHPVMFDASYVWVVNSTALRLSGITRDTPNPRGGEIVKDAHGEPNGILRNAGSLLKRLDTDRSLLQPAEKQAALEQQLRRYVAAGLTAVSDRAVSGDDITVYRELYAKKRLPIRAVLTLRLGASGTPESVIERLQASGVRTGEGPDPGWLKFGAFKVTLDGGMTIGTAYQRAPYGEFGRQLYGMTNPDDRGQRFIEPEKLFRIFQGARDSGWQLTAHSQGGGAIDTMLDAFERLDKLKPIAPTRSHLMHASFQHPDAIARAAKLGIAADVQAAWLYFDGPALEKVFQTAGMRYFFPLRSYLKAGIIVAGGSDHMIGHDKNRAVNPYNPFHGLWVSVARKTTRGDVLVPEERVTREEALRMYTIWAAWMQFAEKSRGSIETGKLADLVVIDRDYLACPEDEIRLIEPVAVLLDGRIVSGKL
ncbi:MAG: amidohydrolase, partial [Bryobacteraceae bacterium]